MSSLNAVTSAVEYKTTVTIPSLIAARNYKVYLFVKNSLGESAIKTVTVKTANIPYGSYVSIPMTKFVAVADVINALSLSLQVPKSQLSVLTSETKLKNSFSNLSVSNNVYYDVMISPNEVDDTIPTSSIAGLLTSSAAVKIMLSGLLP